MVKIILKIKSSGREYNKSNQLFKTLKSYNS